MTDRDERPYRMQAIDEEGLLEDDHFDKESAYAQWQDENGDGAGIFKKYWMFLALLALALIGLAIVYAAMRPRTATGPAAQIGTALDTRIKALEAQVARLEKQVTQGRADSLPDGASAEVVDRLSSRVDRLESSFQTWMEEVTTKKGITPPAPAARKSAAATVKKPAAVKNEKKTPVKKTPAKVPAKTQKAPAARTAVRYHTVQSGETLYRISRTYGLPVERLKKINRLPGNTIKPGQKLRVSP